MKKSLGMLIISELGRRGQLGNYFDYAGYRALRKVDSYEALREFLWSRGLADVQTSTDPAQVVDALAQAHVERELRNPMNFVHLDPTGCLPMVFFPFWMVLELFRSRGRGG